MRSGLTVSLAVGLLISVTSVAGAHAPTSAVTRCSADAVVAGTVCLDRYEASVWRVPNPTTTNAMLVRRIQQGRATRADLLAGGATPLGTASDDYAPCTDNGQTCANDIFAVSLPSEIPSSHITWFQAQEACANAGKRLPTSAEWQVGANGTPDPGPDNRTTDCNTAGDGTVMSHRLAQRVRLGARRVRHGRQRDGVGGGLGAACRRSARAGRSFSDDIMCLAGASTTGDGPGALMRGGDFSAVTSAGPLAVIGARSIRPAEDFIGFRCARCTRARRMSDRSGGSDDRSRSTWR